MTPLELTFVVGCTPAHAFDVWTRRTTLWWPSDHSVSGDPDLTVTIEPRVGGRIYERAPDGTEHDWGRIVTWKPPRHLGYRWHIVGDPQDATDVDITFDAHDDGTLVTIVHDGWERLGAPGARMRERNQQGWTSLLPHYRAAVVARGVRRGAGPADGGCAQPLS